MFRYCGLRYSGLTLEIVDIAGTASADERRSTHGPMRRTFPEPKTAAEWCGSRCQESERTAFGRDLCQEQAEAVCDSCGKAICVAHLRIEDCLHHPPDLCLSCFARGAELRARRARDWWAHRIRR